MNICSVPNCGKKHFANGYCNKHNLQIKYHGKIKERTIFDSNEIVVDVDICRMKIYNNKGEEIAETIFDLKYKDQIESSKLKWGLSSKGYVATTWIDTDGLRQHISLHQAIVQLSGQTVENDQEIDHKDNNPLHNLENNIRICNSSQNQQNIKMQKNNTSGYKGVTWYKPTQKWQAQIRANGKKYHLGYFEDIKDAARAYNAAAIKYYGEFAQLNIIK